VSNSDNPTNAPLTSARARRRQIVLALLALAATGVALAVWLRPSPVPQPTPVAVKDEDEDDTVPPAANPGFVGIGACAECHAKRVAEFRATRHFLASVPASGVKAPGFGNVKSSHPTRDPDVHFEMVRQANDLIVTGVRRASPADQRIDYHIGLAYGAGGTRDEMYFAWQDDRLVQLPVAWLYPQARWGNVVDRIEAREVSPNCLECHTTWAAHVPGTLNQYRRESLLLGVTCERCHGTGKAHTDYHRANPGQPARTVLHPGKLDRERSMDLCAQCHTNVKRRGAPFSYRPGQPLEGSFRAVQPKYSEDNIVGNQVQALRASRCFQKSDMTCTTCHDPHSVQQPAEVRAVCLKCHTPESCKEQPRLPVAVRSDCTGCHTPPRVWMNVHFHTADDQYVPVAARTDHRIGIYPDAKQSVVLAWLRGQNDPKIRPDVDRLASDLGAHWLKEVDALQKVGRLKAAIGASREALKVNPDDRTRERLRDAIARQSEFDLLRKKIDLRRPDLALSDLKKILEIRPDDASAHSQMGSAYASLGNHDKAVSHLEAVAIHDPDDASGLTFLARMEYIDGRPEKAVTLSARADAIDPANATIHYQWGLALLKLQRWGEAGAHFTSALAVQPRHAGASRGLSEALRAQGQAAEAVRHARRAVRWTEWQNAEMLLTLARAYSAAKRPDDARRTLEDALRTAERSNPALVPVIRAEFESLK
jgi:tetratricopeptide (TPR) repeat protein